MLSVSTYVVLSAPCLSRVCAGRIAALDVMIYIVILDMVPSPYALVTYRYSLVDVYLMVIVLDDVIDSHCPSVLSHGHTCACGLTSDTSIIMTHGASCVLYGHTHTHSLIHSYLT
jgi:hypothetical protein